MLDHTVPGVKQPNKYSCGAACCLYIMRMLRVAEDDDTVETIMPGLRTIPGFDTFGSSPRNIGNLILERSRSHGRAGVSVRRGSGRSHWGGRFYLSFVEPGRAQFPTSGLAQAASSPDWNRGTAVTAYPDLAILRGLVAKHGSWKEAHWVVQTHNNGQTKVMDPSGPVINAGAGEVLVQTVPSFQEWMNGWREARPTFDLSSIHFHSNGLDLEITG